MKKPTIIEISVKAMNHEGIEKEFYFESMDELKEWWKNPYKPSEYHGVMDRSLNENSRD